MGDLPYSSEQYRQRVTSSLLSSSEVSSDLMEDAAFFFSAFFPFPVVDCFLVFFAVFLPLCSFFFFCSSFCFFCSSFAFFFFSQAIFLSLFSAKAWDFFTAASTSIFLYGLHVINWPALGVDRCFLCGFDAT